MISYPDARRMSPNPGRDAARSELARSLREMRRSTYDQPEEMRFAGHAIARNAFQHYRAYQQRLNRLILQEAYSRGETIN